MSDMDKVHLDSESDDDEGWEDGRPGWMVAACVWYHPYLDHAYCTPLEPEVVSFGETDTKDKTENASRNGVDTCMEDYEERSDDSFDEDHRFGRKYEKLLGRCVEVQRENERLVYHLQQLRRAVKRRRKERKFLMDRLDKYGDAFRTTPIAYPIEDVTRIVKAAMAPTVVHHHRPPPKRAKKKEDVCLKVERKEEVGTSIPAPVSCDVRSGPMISVSS